MSSNHMIAGEAEKRPDKDNFTDGLSLLNFTVVVLSVLMREELFCLDYLQH